MPPTHPSPMMQSRILSEAILEAKPQRLEHLDAVLQALDQPGRVVVVEVPWYPDGGTHLLRLKRVKGDRLFFLSAPRDPRYAPGTKLGQGLPRRLEVDGTESATLHDFGRLFMSGKGEALVF